MSGIATQPAMFGQRISVGPTYDADFIDYLNRGIINGGVMTLSNQDAVNDFFIQTKIDEGVATMALHPSKASCLLAAWDNLQGALTPIVGTAPTNVSGLFVSGDYSRTLGLKGDGTSKYLLTNRNNNDDPLNSRHLFTYVTEAETRAAVNAVLAGGRNSTTSTYIQKFNFGINAYYLTASGPQLTATLSAPYIGGFGISRPSATVVDRIFKGLFLANVANASSSVFPDNLGVFGFSAGNSFTNARQSFYSQGTHIKLDLLNSRIATLMAELT